MQKEALRNLKNKRKEGETKAVIIAATGTGKTFLAAFDFEQFKPNKYLFLPTGKSYFQKQSKHSRKSQIIMKILAY